MKLENAFKNLLSFGRRAPVVEDTSIAAKYGHVIAPAAFDDYDKARQYKIAADQTLPWIKDLTLNGHIYQEGMFQGFNGFMGYSALSLLQQNGLIKACIDTIADEMTREFIEIKKDGETEEDDEVKIIKDMFQKHQIRELFNRAIRANEVFGGCMIFIDTGASDDELLMPLHIAEWSEEIKRFRRFQLIEPINVFPGVYNSIDPTKKDYFEPQTWFVLGKRVHTSRLIKLRTSNLWQVLKPAYNFFGVPHAQILIDYVLHFQKCRVATANAATKFSRTILKTDMQSLLVANNGAEQLRTRLAILSDTNNDGMTGIDFEGEDIAQVNMPLAGLTDITWQGLEMLCVVNKSPAVKTLGVSPSGFSATGDSDFKNWYDHVRSKQQKDIGDQVKTCLRIMQIVALGRVDPSITFDFAQLSTEDEAKIAEVNKINTQSVVLAYDANMIDQHEGAQLLRDLPKSIFASLGDVNPGDLPDETERENLARTPS